MATLVQDPGNSSSAKKRRRRRARREASEAIQATQMEAANGESGLAAPLGVPESEVTVALVPDPEPAVSSAVLLPATVAVPDNFKDLLGQAVGLRLDSVSREFGGNHEMHVTALKNVSIEIGPSEFVSVVGPSGCGKTTLLSLMGGLDRPTSGHVYGAGLPLGELSERDLADYPLQRGSTIFQAFN